MRETVDNASVYKLGYLLETPEYPALLAAAALRLIHPMSTVVSWSTAEVTMRQVRSISRKGWMHTSQVSSMERAAFT